MRNISLNEITQKEQKDLFWATVVHDLKTPLVAQIRSLELLRKEYWGKINNEQKKILDIIIESSDFMKEMLYSLLETSKIENGFAKLNIEYFNINQLIELCINEYKNLAIHGGVALMGLTDLIVHAGVKQDALGGRSLARVDVGHDADVARVFELVLSFSHKTWFSKRSGTCRPGLEAIVREGAVGLRHLEQVLATLDGRADTVGGIHDLVGEALGHGLLLAGAREVDHPANGERGGTTGVDLHGHLVGGAADALGLDLERGAHVVHGLLEDGQRILLGALLDDVEGIIDDALGDGLLAVKQDLVDQLRDEAVVVLCVRHDLTTDCCCTTRHVISSLLKKKRTTGPVPGLPQHPCAENARQRDGRYLGRLAP